MSDGSLRGYVESTLRLPEIDGARCVHAHIETSRCRRCIDACPKNAWRLDDESLGLAVDACDGCGLCVPACPEEAIRQELPVGIRNWKGVDVACVACAQAVEQGDFRPVIACVHALGVRDLDELYARGVRFLIVAHGDCAQCDKGGCGDLAARVKGFNTALEALGRTPLQWMPMPADRWLRIWSAMTAEGQGPGQSRRRFLLGTLHSAVEFRLDRKRSDRRDARGGEGDYLSALAGAAEREEAVFAHVPVIDGQRCDGCDACVRVCPHHALALTDGGYEVSAARCTGCGMCEDVCVSHAVTVEAWSRNPRRFLPLTEARCRSCGVSFHRPQGRESGAVRCAVCEKIDHQKNLYQVLEESA